MEPLLNQEFYAYQATSWNGKDLVIEVKNTNASGVFNFIGIKNPHPAWYRLTYENDDGFEIRSYDGFFSPEISDFKAIKEGRSMEYRIRYGGKYQIVFSSKNRDSHPLGWTTTLRNLKIIELKDENEVIDD